MHPNERLLVIIIIIIIINWRNVTICRVLGCWLGGAYRTCKQLRTSSRGSSTENTRWKRGVRGGAWTSSWWAGFSDKTEGRRWGRTTAGRRLATAVIRRPWTRRGPAGTTDISQDLAVAARGDLSALLRHVNECVRDDVRHIRECPRQRVRWSCGSSVYWVINSSAQYHWTDSVECHLDHHVRVWTVV